MAKGFAEQSGGALAIDSAPGRGPTVHLWLPRADAAMAPAPREAGTTAAPPALPKHARVLVVDDDLPVLETLAAQLQDSGFSVVTAAGGEQAMALIDSDASLDAMVTDLSMPGVSGVELIRQAQQRRPRMPALLLTGYATDGAAQALCSQTKGTVLLVRKPARAKKLIDRLAALLAAAE
jgi:CheY-like chemotaxis protein